MRKVKEILSAEEISRRIVRYLEDGVVDEKLMVNPSDELLRIFRDSPYKKLLGYQGLELEFAGFIEKKYGIPIHQIAEYKNQNLTISEAADLIYNALQKI